MGRKGIAGVTKTVTYRLRDKKHWCCAIKQRICMCNISGRANTESNKIEPSLYRTGSGVTVRGSRKEKI